MLNSLNILNLLSADNERIRLEVSGTKCVIHGTQALKKDVGIWDFHVATAENGSQNVKHFQFYISVNGTYEALYIFRF